MDIYQQCKQCYFYPQCSNENNFPEEHPCGVWETIRDKRDWMKGHMMDCFKSPQQYKRDIETAEKSKLQNK